jgi:hypothetical protein
LRYDYKIKNLQEAVKVKLSRVVISAMDHNFSEFCEDH